MQSRLGLAHFLVFVFCGLISISACCLGVLGVIAQGSAPVRQAHAVLSNPAEQMVRQAITHPRDKKWEPVFVLSRYDSGSSVE